MAKFGQLFLQEGMYDVTYAFGYGGQHIYTVPELNMVVVTAADYSDSEGMSLQRRKITNIVRNEILLAVTPWPMADG